MEETGKKEDSQMDTVNQSNKRKEGRKEGRNTKGKMEGRK